MKSAEWSKAPVLKTGERESVPWVQTHPQHNSYVDFLDIEKLVWTNLGPERYLMAAIDKRSNGLWRVRIKNRISPVLSKTFSHKTNAM